ncbi:MAG TPA: HAMP domain-containing protein [Vicinamibacterales bacterium]|nr:HAMP domain-containing protein [Vicinamibacterales bacterium]
MATAATQATDMLDQKRLLKVLSDYKRGDFSARMPSDRTGMAGKICDTLNECIERNQRLTSELQRLSAVVGKAGNIKQRASLPSAEGDWEAAVDAVNALVSDLVQPTTEVARVIGAVAKGDLSQSMALEIDGRPLTGEFLRSAKVVNTMVDQLGTFASEVTRVAREVGSEGKLGGQAVVKGVAGTWKDLTDNVNSMAANLTSQVRNVAEVTTAVANGDLSKKITVDVKGEMQALKETINTMVDQLSSFASEVTRVAKEVGTEGKLGGQAEVKGVAGTWRDLTDNVNQLAGNLTVQLRDVSKVATAIAGGDLSKKITVDARGEILQIKEVINTMVDQLGSFASEVTRVAKEVGTEGALGGQAEVRGVAGTWKDLTDNVNAMARNLTGQVRNIAEVTTAVARGDLSKKITVDVRGELLELKNTINTMVDQLSSFASEVSRVAKEVGNEGKLGGQAEVKGVAGTWRDLTDNVNQLAGNLTVQLRDVSKVATAIASGDLTQKITVDAQGEILQIKNVINTMTDQLNAFASEVTRVAREVGTEGKLGGQADVRGVAGTWRDLTDSVNFMASNLTGQVRNIADVTTAVARGDLSRKITVDVRGEILELKNTINTMVDQLSAFASEVTRVSREVGTEGKLGGQAIVPGVGGTWKDLTDSVNFMAGNLTSQVRNIAEVTTAVANGDLSKKITVDVRGEILELKNTINVMVDQLNGFASEVSRVAREVGTEGKLGGQAEVKGVAGTWKDLTDNVNQLAGNLTVQLRDVSRVATAIATGDLSQKIEVEVRGELLQIKEVVNRMVDQLGSFASEVSRVSREVGSEGKLGGQADVRGVAGTWKDLTDNVNFMAGNLTGQVRNIAEVTTAVANGDLSKKITVDVRGEILELKNTINTMVDQLGSFASEVTRVAREVGTEGKLGGQAEVEDVAGTWKDLTDNVNSMASNLTSQVRNIADVTTAVANGDLSKKITVDVRGEMLELKNTVNTMVDQLNAFASEVTRVAREVGTEGKLGGQAQVRGVGGTWKDLTDSVNFMAGNLTDQVRNIATVTTAVANGDLTKKITVDVKGEILELKNTVNTMVDQLRTFASEVTRVAREVGSEGKLGGQADVQGVGGTWKDLTDNVNFMADNLTNQVRGIAKVVTEVANGNLKRKLVLDAKGEIEELAETINGMIDTLALFADQVTGVAREVGIEGKLGGQAEVPGAAGTWRDLTDNVNRLAANLTTQVRAIAEVSTAVTKGDLSRSIAVEAAGEVASLKDNINEMIGNLRETTEKNTAQDWLKTNLANFSRLLQGQRDLIAVARTILSELAPLVQMQHGVFYINESANGVPDMRLLASYAYTERKNLANRFEAGEGLVGQAALEREPILISNVPEDYVQISSGLGMAKPMNIVVLPILFEGDVKAVVEVASFNRFTDSQLTFLTQLTESIGIVLNTITATMKTEELLKQSQTLAVELQTRQEELTETNAQLEQQARTLQASEERLKQQQEELQQTNEELEEKAELLARQNLEVEQKNKQIETARMSLEEKAEQLALTSKYKSEFLANMSHELRTPLNSLLILSKLLASNEGANLTDKQVEFARTIHSSGSDLLELINEVLDLAKVESGMMDVDVRPVIFSELKDYVERSFREVASAKDLEFTAELGDGLPNTIETDPKRLQQVLKNLLSNAIKFTETGSVTLSVSTAQSGWTLDHRQLSIARQVVAFSVTDTGIGIPADKHRIIFESFQQADGTTSRKYGGTGLGLSISREIARMLGGEIRLESEPGRGSTFTLFLPSSFMAQRDTTQTVPNTPRDHQGYTPRPIVFDESLLTENEVEDDRDRISENDMVVLVVENDIPFLRILMDRAKEKGFKCLAAVRGDVGLAMARHYRPDAITLDIEMPGMDGWSVLDRLKHDPITRHIPVHIISSSEESHRGMRLGAMAYLEKPVEREALDDAFAQIRGFVDRKVRNLLIVEDDDVERQAIVELIGNGDVKTTAVRSGEEALERLSNETFDCLVLDLGLDDMTGLQLLETMKADPRLSQIPVIVYTGKELNKKQETELRRLAETIIVKDVKSPDRLLDETALFLHRVESNLPAEKRRMLEQLHSSDPSLAGTKALIVDDDIRNIFALTSVLERHEVDVVYAENGRDGIRMLQETPDIDVVLMDVMMPEMDGYEAMRKIRELRQFKDLPIIALTAKAMKGDREKCIEAGASDYVTKPVDTDQLLSLMRVWVSR